MTPKAATSVGIMDDELDFMVEARWIKRSASAAPLAGILHADGSSAHSLCMQTGIPLGTCSMRSS